MKKVIMAAAVLCLGLLLGAGCGTDGAGTEEEEVLISLSKGEQAEKLKDLAAFCNEHREKLNEMSEYFLDAVEDVSDYEDEEKLPDIDELAAALTDKESKEILDKLESYYPLGYREESKQVYYYYPYDYEGECPDPEFIVVYIKADGRMLEESLNNPCWPEVRKIDKYLFAVIERCPYV